MLLGRPAEQPCAQQSDDEQVSLGSADDVSLRSERRHIPVLRLAQLGSDDDDAWSVDLVQSAKNNVLWASERELALDAAVRSPYRVEHPSSRSARGPPSIRS